MDNRGCERAWLWGNRIGGILICLFVAMFSLDMIGGGRTLSETLVGLFWHNIPTYFLLAILLISWRWEILGSLLYVLAAVAIIVVFGFGAAAISMPLVVLALSMFLHSQLAKKEALF